MGPKLSLTVYDPAQTLSTVIEFIATFHNITLLILHCYCMIKAKKEIKAKWSIFGTEYWSILSISLLVLFDILTIVTSFGLHPRFISCKIYMDLFATEYLLSKMSLYLLFLSRFHVFNDTRYQFKPRNILICKICLIIYLIGCTIMAFTTGKGHYVVEHNICAGNRPFFSRAIVAFGDFFIGIFMSIVFTRKLMQFGYSSSKYINQTPDNIKSNTPKTEITPKNNISITMQTKQTKTIIDTFKNENMFWSWDALNKFTLLAIIAICTTLTSLILSAVFELSSLWISIDTMINTWCVLLLFSPYKKLYVSICKTCQNCCITDRCLSLYGCNCGCCKIETPLNVQKVISMQSMQSVQITPTTSTPTQTAN
eukprot:399745_1